jgi:hypothetical protein
MISEMTSPVRRLLGPSGSKGGARLALPTLVTFPKSRNAAVASWLVLWLETPKPK